MSPVVASPLGPRSRGKKLATNNGGHPVSAYEVQVMFLRKAVQILDTSAPASTLVSRDQECNDIYVNISSWLLEKTSASVLLLCGPPGTGKTSTVVQQIASLTENAKLRSMLDPKWSITSCILNGALFHTTTSFLKSFCDVCMLNSKDSAGVAKAYTISGYGEALKEFQRLRSKKTTSVVVVIDEVDQLIQLLPKPNKDSRKQPYSSKYSKPRIVNDFHQSFLEELVSVANSSGVIVIMISNALTLATSIQKRQHSEAASPAVAAVSSRPATDRPISAPSPPPSTSRRSTRNSNSATAAAAEVGHNGNKAVWNRLYNVKVFESYSDDALKCILEKRLELVRTELKAELHQAGLLTPYLENCLQDFTPFDENARNLAFKKLSAHSGDCRQMLDTCRQLLLHKLTSIENAQKPHGGGAHSIYNTFASTFSRDSPEQKCRRPLEPAVDSVECSDSRQMDDDNDFEPSKTTPSSKQSSSASKLSSTRRGGQTGRKDGKGTDTTTTNLVPRSASVSTAPSSPRSSRDGGVPLQVSMEETLQVLNQQFQQSKRKCTEVLSSLPLHQQILLCAVCVVVQEHQNPPPADDSKRCDDNINNNDYPYNSTKREISITPVEIRSVQAGYINMCKSHSVPIEYTNVNFMEGMLSLQQSGVIAINQGRDADTRGRSALPRAPRGAIKGLAAAQKGRGAALRRESGTVTILLDLEDVREVLAQLKMLFTKWLSND